jgi:tripartite-type tricarboxylate transporter receptor subunit TctC
LKASGFAGGWLLIFAIIAFGGSTAIGAEKYPTRPIKLIIPQGAGGANDAIARIYAQDLQASIGQPVIVENRAGAGGVIGTTAVAKATPDGYTLLLTVTSAHTIAPFLYKNLDFDPIKDFEPITTLATAGYLLVAAPDFPATSVQQLIDLAKSQPGKISFASAGNGTLNHLLGELLQKQAGIQLVHIPYKSSSAAVTDVIGGRVPISFQSVASSIGFVKAGRLKVLGAATEKRMALFPDYPVIGETLAGFGATPWYGLLAPAGTPKEIIEGLRAHSVKVMASGDLKDKLALTGAEVMTTTPADFAALIRAELPKWDRIVKSSGATVD